MASIRPGDYIGIHAYLPMDPATEAALDRTQVQDRKPGRQRHHGRLRPAFSPFDRPIAQGRAQHRGLPAAGRYPLERCADTRDRPHLWSGHRRPGSGRLPGPQGTRPPDNADRPGPQPGQGPSGGHRRHRLSQVRVRGASNQPFDLSVVSDAYSPRRTTSYYLDIRPGRPVTCPGNHSRGPDNEQDAEHCIWCSVPPGSRCSAGAAASCHQRRRVHHHPHQAASLRVKSS